MNDHELDELFREAAAKSGAPDRREVVWANLEKKLDVPRRPRSRKWIYLLLLLVVMLGLGLWQRYPLRTSKAPRPVGGTQASSAHEPGHPSSMPRQAVVHPGKSAVPGKRVPAPRPPAGDSYRTSPPVTPSGEWASQAVFRGVTRSGYDGSLPVLSRSRRVIAWSWPTPPAELLSMDRSFPTKMQPASVSGNSQPSLKAASKAARKRELSSKAMHWTIGITAGPDWSSVAARGWGTGIGGGLTLGYRLNDRWALSTAVLMDKKIYNAVPNDYNPPDNTWRNYDVQHIDANCIVMDVPLNLSYTLWSEPHHRVLLTTGMSSFWMDKEEYTYHYKTAGGYPDQWSEELYGKNRHFFSILNLSAGYQKSWNHISFEAAPYVKIPLHGIGYGRVKLLSTGVHFTLGYGLK